MGLLNRLRGDFPHPAWHYAAQGTLWQVQVGSSRFLVGEARDEGKKRASFFSVRRKTGEVNWEGVNPVDTWWAGMEGVFREVVLFHGFATPDLPIHRGIFAVDGVTGVLLWSNPDLRFLWCAGGVVGARSLTGEDPAETLFDLRTGVVTDGGREGGILRSAAGEPDEPATFPCLLGRDFRNDGIGFEKSRWAIPADAETDSLYGLLSERDRVVEYAVRGPGSPESPPSFRVHIVVLDRESGLRRFEATVLAEAPAARPQPFFVQGGVLFYVADRTTLVALPLRKD
jgi:hypothetical protein